MFSLAACGEEDRDVFELELIATLDSAPLSEISGIARSNRYTDVYWVHNDSGDSSRIFAINSEGKSILPTFSRFSYYGEVAEDGKQQWEGFKVLFAENVDWEDMTADGTHLYVADTGNNANKRRDLGIYVLSEIDPTASTQSAAIKHIPVAYPDQKEFPGDIRHFDSESLFWSEGKLYLITKHREATMLNRTFEKGANLYRLDSEDPDQLNTLTRIDHHELLNAPTSAEVSPDGQQLAVLTNDAVWIFEKPEDDRWLSAPAQEYPFDTAQVRQIEAVTWDDAYTLRIINEQRQVFRFRIP